MRIDDTHGFILRFCMGLYGFYGFELMDIILWIYVMRDGTKATHVFFMVSNWGWAPKDCEI